MKKNTKNLPASVEVSEDTIALSLSQQYDDLMKSTQELVHRTLHFGAALAQAEIELSKRGLLNNRKNGQGMQGWLAKNCPSVNYKTAMRWKSLAAQVANSLSCSSEEALKLLTGDTTIEVPNKVSEKLNTIYEQGSLRKLTQLMFDFASEGSAGGRPAGTGATDSTEKYSAVESARRLWAKLLSFIVVNRGALYKAAKILPVDDARNAKAEIDPLLQVLNTLLK